MALADIPLLFLLAVLLGLAWAARATLPPGD